ncbi:MAG: hypothetical protein U0587_16370 [Candidatus Binatia bacterium]
MTQEEILAMKPGRELNSTVAAEIIGHVVVQDELLGDLEGVPDEDGSHIWDHLQPYSEDIEAADIVVDTMIRMGFEDAVCWADFGDGCYTEPEAICKAALLAKLYPIKACQ